MLYKFKKPLPKRTFRKGTELSVRTKRPWAVQKTNLYSPSQIYHFKRQLEDGLMYTSGANTLAVTNATGGTPGWISVSALAADQGGVALTAQFGFSVVASLVNVVNSGSFTGLFEEYALDRIEVKIVPVMGDSYDAVASQLVTIYSYMDYDDAVPPPDMATAQRRMDVKEHQLSQMQNIKVSCRPRCAAQFFISAVGTGYGPSVDKQWLDSAY